MAVIGMDVRCGGLGAVGSGRIGQRARETERMSTDARLAWLKETAEGNDAYAPATPPPDGVAAAALALAKQFGWWYDPVLSPETVLEIAELVAGMLIGEESVVIPKAEHERLLHEAEHEYCQYGPEDI